MKKLNVTVNVSSAATISAEEIGRALMTLFLKDTGIDDAGCDLYTNGEDEIYLGNEAEALVYKSKNYARMVDTSNFIRYGKTLIAAPAKSPLGTLPGMEGHSEDAAECSRMVENLSEDARKRAGEIKGDPELAKDIKTDAAIRPDDIRDPSAFKAGWTYLRRDGKRTKPLTLADSGSPYLDASAPGEMLCYVFLNGMDVPNEMSPKDLMPGTGEQPAATEEVG